MQRQKIIDQLLAADSRKAQSILIDEFRSFLDLQFARDLKETYYRSWTTAPQKTINAANALEKLRKVLNSVEVDALAMWVRGIADLTEGKIQKAVRDLGSSAELFLSIDQEHNAAQTLVAKLVALAHLGLYEESAKVGKHALSIFEKYHDELAAGKVEKNLGNIAARQGHESVAEKYYIAARKRFVRLEDQSELAMCDNSLANTYAELNNFKKAEFFYKKALENARLADMRVTEAEIEASMGNLATFRGRFDEALRFLELSRQKYDELQMPHQMAIADLEIASIYLELNLWDEACEILERVSDTFKRLKLRGEEARSRSNLARALTLLSRPDDAKRELKASANLYLAEKNMAGAAGVTLTRATLELQLRNFKAALKAVDDAEMLLEISENPRQKLLSNWIRGEALSNLCQFDEAEKLLSETLRTAIRSEQINLAQVVLTSLGNLSAQTNDINTAKKRFTKAVRMIERLRAPLAAEEFRMAFLSDKLTAFESLAKLYLAENDLKRAFSIIERARARTLSESLKQFGSPQPGEGIMKLDRRLFELREELNWFYSRLSRAEAAEFSSLQKEVKKREKQIAELIRQIGSTLSSKKQSHGIAQSDKKEFARIQKQLGPEKALVEYVSFGGIISAFVITDKKIRYFDRLADETEIVRYLEGLRFQFESLRFGRATLNAYADQLKKRTDMYLQKLYEKLIRPLEICIERRDLTIVPVGPLHYVPFNALRDGEQYLIETREVTHSPSASVWSILNEKSKRKPKNALLMGFADDGIPFVTEEVRELQTVFSKSAVFTGADATFENFTRNADKYDVLHLACHGQFRPDSPMFSSLRMANGNITVRDICAQKLNAEVVTLSACETGLNKVFAGDEILGLARGFLSAGANSLVLSLWTVSDEATSELMKVFYLHLQRGESAAASLRQAQLTFIGRNEHPYYWSPFVLIGR